MLLIGCYKVQHGNLRTDRGSRLVNEFFLRFIVLHLLQARLQVTDSNIK